MNFFDFLKKYGAKAVEREVTRGNADIQGIVTLNHFREGRLIGSEKSTNLIVDQGLNHFLNVVMGATAKITTWYVGIFKNNVTPAAADVPATALGAAGTFGECQDADYDVPLTNKPEYIDAVAVAKVMSNSGTPASFTMASSITVYGAFISSVTAKTGTTGTLLAAKKFDTARPVIDNDILTVQYDITAASV
jgi:hypothetical protein